MIENKKSVRRQTIWALCPLTTQQNVDLNRLCYFWFYYYIIFFHSTVFPAKRFMVTKKKRSLNGHSAVDNTSTKSKIATNFERRFANNAHRF